jgi:3-oxoacyl-[acyl-carrier protein] reductase
MILLRGRTALVTGAASGIGRAIALRLAREGVNLVLTDRAPEGLAATERDTRSLGVSVTSAVCDLAKPADISAMLARLFAGAPLHILVNCAGLNWFGPLHTSRDAEWRDVMAVNLLAPIQITTELMNLLLRADEAHIVNIASMLGLAPGRKLAAYTASKYGLVGFTLAMRTDYHRSHFGISAICPGFVKTPMLNNPDNNLSQPNIPDWLSTTPEHVADVTIDAILRNRGLVLVTLLARLAWWANRLSPALVDYLGREGWRQRGRIVPPPAPNA